MERFYTKIVEQRGLPTRWFCRIMVKMYMPEPCTGSLWSKLNNFKFIPKDKRFSTWVLDRLLPKSLSGTRTTKIGFAIIHVLPVVQLVIPLFYWTSFISIIKKKIQRSDLLDRIDRMN
jgi:hypothetical protein